VKKIALVMVAVLAMAAMTVRSASKPTGSINVPARLLLELKIDGKPVLVPSGTECPMPAGTYAPDSITARAEGEEVPGKRDIWSITSRGPFGKRAQIEIKDGATTTIDAGPPFVLNVAVSKAQNTPQGKVVRINLQVLGRMGEVYAPNTLRKGRTVAPAPQLEVLDEKGTSLAKGNFEYG